MVLYREISKISFASFSVAIKRKENESVMKESMKENEDQVVKELSKFIN